ncbi:MAG: hypothetical protein ABSA59_15745 [Terriglobia bacterium]|jgi:hypothetical protein
MAEITEEPKSVPPGPPPVIHFTFEGKQERAVELDFDVKSEGWSTYSLEDGTVIKMKNVTSRVLKLLDRVKEDGSPFYILEGVAVVTTIKPEPPANQTGDQNA